MREFFVRDWCSIDNLTQDSSWKKIKELLDEQVDPNEEVMLDFKGVNVVEPWTLDAFGDILKMENVNFRFTSSNKESLESFVNRIKMRCIVEGLREDRIESIYIEPIKKKTKEELRIEKIGEEFVHKFQLENEIAVIEMNKIYDQIGSINTIDALVYAIKKLHSENGTESFIIKTAKMFIQANILELMAKYVIELELDEGINLSIDTDNEENAKKLSLYIYTAMNESYDTVKKLKAFSKLPTNMPGMLIKYKHSRAVDEFGRHGKGQVVSNRIAIYRGICKRNNNRRFEIIGKIEDVNKDGVITESGEFIPMECIGIVVESFKNDKFMTHAEWITRFDGEMVDEHGNEVINMPKDVLVINVDSIGLMDKFLGKQYHFIKAVQRDIEHTKDIIVDINENGNCVRQAVTIPERIKIVAGDWNIKVNPIELEKAIEETNRLLNT